MPVVDYAALPEFPMRTGITGKWLSARRELSATGGRAGRQLDRSPGNRYRRWT